MPDSRRSHRILAGMVVLATCLGLSLPLGAQEYRSDKELTFPLEIEGEHSVSVHLFSVLVPGTIRAEVTWDTPASGFEQMAEGAEAPSATLGASLSGKAQPFTVAARAGATTRGSSPLVITREVTSVDVARGVGWRLAIRDPEGRGRASGSVKITIPYDAEVDRAFQREKIELASGQVWPNETLQASFLGRLRQAPTGLHAVISFARTPTVEEAERLEKLGIYRQGFLPRGHAYGLVRKGIDLDDPLISELVRFITPLDAEDKVDPDILVGNYRRFDIPAEELPTENYVLNADGTLELSVLFAPDVSLSRIERILGGVAAEFNPASDQLWEVTISPDRVAALASRDEVLWIEAGPAPYLPTNASTRAFLKVDEVQAAEVDGGGNLVLVGGFPVYHGFSGAGVTVGVQDNGVEPLHTDLDVVFDGPGARLHGTHVAGTISGSGFQSDKFDALGNPNNGDPFEWRGMAPGAAVIDSDVINAASLLTAISVHSLDVSNHSHTLGVDGAYDAANRLVDQEIRGGTFSGLTPVPRRLHVWAAANNGGNSPQYGKVVSYFSILNQMKNALVVGAWTTSSDRLAGFSSMGPSHDGRLKPDVVAPGVGLKSTGGRENERQKIEFDGGPPTMGSFTLTFDGETTAAIAFNASAATVQSRLEALPGVGLGDVQGSGGPLPGSPVSITFEGAFAFTNVPQMTATDSGLDGGASTKITTRPNGSNFLDGYLGMSGTSMASPAACGVTALMLDAWEETYSIPNGTTLDADPPLPSTLRALAIQTAEDVVMADPRGGTSIDVDSDSNPANGNDGLGRVTATVGPDFATGWGKLDAKAAVDLLTEATVGPAPAPRRIIEDSAGQGDVLEYDFEVTDLGPLKATLVWDDFEAAIQNPATGIRLVNDLDLELEDPLGNIHYPWQLGQTILDLGGNPLPDNAQPPGTFIQVVRPITPTATPATDFDYVPANALTGNGAWVAKKGKDHLNNVEQVLVDNLTAPQLGKWKARVIGFDVPSGPQDFSLVGLPNPLPAPNIQVPGSVDLGQVCAGGSTTGTLEVCNTGDEYLYVGPITSSDPSFSVTTPSSGYPVAISPDFCFPFQVVFQPAGSGAQSGKLTVPSNDPDTPSTEVDVFGEGTEPDIRVTGSTDFGVPSAWRPAERTVSVCNVGGCELQVTGAAVSCADFTLVGNPFPATVSPGSCLDLVVGFTPVLQGPKSCDLDINSDDPDTPTVTRPLTARTPPLFSLHIGLVDPHGALGTVTRQGSTFNLDFVYPFRPRWAWDVRAGFTRFDGRAGQPDVELLQASANARFTINPAMPVRFFLNGGLGAYHFDPGDFEGGGNLGIGLGVPVGRRFVFEATFNYHSAFTANPDLEYGQGQLGFLVSF